MIFCSDVDGVILNYIKGFIDFTKDEKIPYIYKPDLYGVTNGILNEDEIRKKFHSTNYLQNLEFYDNSKYVLNNIAKKFELHIVSAIDPQCSEKRIYNLRHLRYKSLKCIGESKKNYIVNKIKPDIMIEDHPDLIRAFTKAGISVFYPSWHLYTKGLDKIAKPFSSWKDFEIKVNKFINLETR